MALKGNPVGDFRALKKRLTALPISLAHDVAAASAPGLTQRTRNAHAAARTVYGDPRPPAADGGVLTLERTGATARTMQFVANGRIVRCVLGTPYARYLIGRYRILPQGAMPAEWSRYLAGLVADANAAKYLRVGP